MFRHGWVGRGTRECGERQENEFERKNDTIGYTLQGGGIKSRAREQIDDAVHCCWTLAHSCYDRISS